MTPLLLALTLLNTPDSQVFSINSAILGQTRRIDVHLPPSFSKTGPDRRYPVIVVFDGEYVSRAVVTTSGELARFGQMPEVVVVGIENRGGSEERVHDLTPPGMSVSGSSTHEGGDQ
ncbi:MAG TPA: alpha/beta hydrolase-fold protein, partial [Thermoanaerobaculia bacterium]